MLLRSRDHITPTASCSLISYIGARCVRRRADVLDNVEIANGIFRNLRDFMWAFTEGGTICNHHSAAVTCSRLQHIRAPTAVRRALIKPDGSIVGRYESFPFERKKGGILVLHAARSKGESNSFPLGHFIHRLHIYASFEMFLSHMIDISYIICRILRCVGLLSTLPSSPLWADLTS